MRFMYPFISFIICYAFAELLEEEQKGTLIMQLFHESYLK